MQKTSSDIQSSPLLNAVLGLAFVLAGTGFCAAQDTSLPSVGVSTAVESGSVLHVSTLGVADVKESARIPVQVEKINELVRKSWADFNLSPSAPETDAKWVRRLYVDLLGRIPSPAEQSEFENDEAEDKRAALVQRLLYDERYTLDYARNWTTIWTNLLIGRTGGTANNSLVSREGMQKYLRDSFARNKPYHTMVHDLITATGSTKPGTDNFNGATNFLADKVNEENATLATSSVSKLFLGLQIQCTQCHNHPFNDWKQDKYWEFNAFFRQTRALRRFVPGTDDIASAELIDQDYAGESNNPEKADLFYELRNGLVKVAYPVFVDGTKINPSGYVEDVNRRQELSKLVLGSPYFAQSAINRMWGHFYGYGFTKPIDDLGSHNVPSNVELLSYLAEEFRKSEFDQKKLIEWLVLSEAYQLSSKVNPGNQRDDPTLGEVPQFSHYYIRPFAAEELYESLLLLTRGPSEESNYQTTEEQKNAWLQQFSREFGTDEGDESIDFSGTIAQVLMMFNGEMVRAATRADGGGVLQQILQDPKTDVRVKIERMFEAALARKPSRKEATAFLQLVQSSNSPVEGLEDIWWALLNSNEFIFNH
ncbi:MAG: DUF1549 domain-containing protein [Planctomycetaceae bacterium]|nr:DUF1549 domain-containing protein [Planctomycetaceae bacterium]